MSELLIGLHDRIKDDERLSMLLTQYLSKPNAQVLIQQAQKLIEADEARIDGENQETDG